MARIPIMAMAIMGKLLVSEWEGIRRFGGGNGGRGWEDEILVAESMDKERRDFGDEFW